MKSTAHNPSTINRPGVETGDRIGLSLKGSRVGTVVASLALSAAATLAANTEHDGEHFPSGVQVGLHDVLPGSGDVMLPGIGLDIHTTHTHEVASDCPDRITNVPGTDYEVVVVTTEPMKFAREFDRDPAARENRDNDAALGQVMDYLRTKIAAGEDIRGIQIHGFASDEDEAGGYYDGLGSPSQKNVDLATVRAEAGKGKLMPLIMKEFGPSVANLVTVTGGTEIQDTALNQAIIGLAQLKGMSPHALMERYKFDPQSLTVNDRKVLEGLDNDRYIAITVTTALPVTRQYVEVVEGKCVTRTVEEGHDKVVLILVPVIWPVLRIAPKLGPVAAPEAPKRPPLWPQGDPVYRSGLKELPGHRTAVIRQKQPGQHNNGGNNGSRGQRHSHARTSSYRIRSGRG